MRMRQMQLEVGTDPREVGRARGWARSRLARSGLAADEPLVETLVLLVSELVTNAVVHTGRPARLRMLLSGRLAAGRGTVRIEVADTCACPPLRRRAGDDDTGGRGLELVGALADRWGWRPEDTGKRIWCELDRDAAAPGTDPAGDGGAPAGTVSGETVLARTRSRPGVRTPGG
ncbi:ATP-binding protein [Streptomyces sp. TRM 70361]|uniref:ATP-binding protein n=1 Tax=Streptomyces sp. TRM 70361 TaxID=3116553 RepID=UPI002E7AC11B|nr:ATP-binding protein [Streptomyces sp. TRM 70361]MEE1938373.1 ATP-binding protein [Streptomyces sp. TRM 70361]